MRAHWTRCCRSFPEQKLLDLRNTVLEEEKTRLGQLQAALRRIDEKIRLLRDALKELAEQMRKAQAEGVTIAELMALNAHRSNIDLQLKELAQRRAEAQKKVDRQLQVVVEASREVSKLEKVEQRQYELYREMEKKAESNRVEELVVTNISRRSVG